MISSIGKSINFGRGLVMACLNTNSLLAHIDELKILLNTYEKIDILAINETKLDTSISDREIHLPGFEIARKDRIINGRNGGGICIYVRSNINFRLRDDLGSTNLECLTIEITNPRSRPFLVSTWYRPPQSPLDLFSSFEELIDKIDAENKDFFLLGDLNCNLLPGIADNNSLHLRNIIDVYGLSQLITEPTRITQRSKTLIDLCLTNSPQMVSNSGVIHVGISDHSLIYLTRKMRYTRSGVHKTSEMRQLKNFNIDHFLHDLRHQKWDSVCITNDPNEMWDAWKHLLMSVIDKHAPLRTKRISNIKSPWLTSCVIRKIRRRDFLKQKHTKTNNPTVWEQFRKARNDVNNSIKRAKHRYFTKNLDANKKDPKKTWKFINELLNRRCKSTIVSELKIGDQIVSSPADIAEEFNSHFTNIGLQLASEIPESVIDPLSYLQPINKTFSFKTVDDQVILKLLKTIDGKKATGLDNIPCKLLKIAADIVAPSLTRVFNQSIATGVFPIDWKLARVTPIFKKGSKSDLNNYRPISVLPVVAKIFEKVIYDQLYTYLNSNNLLANCQSGFRSLHSTLTALLEATNDWSVNIDKGFLNGVIFIDLRKAFDTIDHKIIMHKLSIYGVDSSTLKWFESYLENRNQKCSVNGHLSSNSRVTCGVPQGSILGPLLFLIYINDLPNCLAEGLPRMYADDTSISFVASNLNDLQQTINKELENVDIWLRSNKLSLNVAKTEFMVVGSRQKLQTENDSSIDIHINGEQINEVESTKSLGVFIDKNLSWKRHIDEISKKISAGIGALKRARSSISRDTAIKIYKALIEPYFYYCSSVWDGLTQQSSDKLQKLQNRAARVITVSSYDTSSKLLLEMLGWDKLYIERKKQKVITVYRAINNYAPPYLKYLFIPRKSTYNLRDFENKLEIPKPRTDYLKRSFSYNGAVLWNDLPKELRLSKSLSHFKKETENLFSKSDSHTANM
ncbi:MAG: hypothetical protein DSY43_04445 [Gammaproteobacteria bacterium]|nr:MAG: hypothetical protein DSY43_04445 [Gammaproteobacteria bacterium]